MPQKAKALLFIIVFLAIILMPVCYALFKEKLVKHKTEQVQKP